MCYHVSLKDKGPEKMERQYGALFDEPGVYKSFFHASGFNHPVLHGIRQENHCEIDPMTWGIVEPGTVDLMAYWKANGGRTLNTQSEFVFTNKRTKGAIMENRCVIPVTGFFEPHKRDGKTFPHYIGANDESYLSLLGCYYEYDTDLYVFTILTSAANPELAKVHNEAKRMPIMGHPNLINNWLSNGLTESDIREIMYTDTNQELEIYPVKKDVMNTRINTDTPDALKRVDYPELQTLF